MKRVFVILLSLFILPMVAFADTWKDNATGITWNYIVKDGKAEVYKGGWTSAIPSSTSGALVVPTQIRSYPVTSIGSYAFCYCLELTSVSIPSSVTQIGNDAFYGCRGLASVIIPASVASIGYEVFRGCTALSEIVVDADNSNYCIHNEILYNKTKTDLICCPAKKTGAVEIPSGVTNLKDGAFYGCSGLAAVSIPDGVTRIGHEIFWGCSGLSAMAIPDGVTEIGENAFYGCSGLISLKIPNSVMNIMTKAFYGCGGLVEITIPEGVTSIGQWAFSCCSGLKSVVIPSSLTSMGYEAFGSCVGLETVTILDGIKSIGRSAFNYCVRLTSVTLPLSVTTIENGAFEYCESLESIQLPESLEMIGDDAFAGCAALKAIVLPEKVSVLGNRVFSRCVALSDVTLSRALTAIPSGTFDGCDALVSFVVPESVVELGSQIVSSATKAIYYLGDAPSCAAEVYVRASPSLVSYVVEGTKCWNGSPISQEIPQSWPTENARAVSKWSPVKIAVTFVGNGGAFGNPAAESYVCEQIANTAYLLPPYEPVRKGYRFDGYWTKIDGGVRITSGVAEKLTKNHSLYAHWERGATPSVDGDEGAVVAGDSGTGFVIKPSIENTEVVVTIPQGVAAAKVTVEVSPKVKSVKPNGAMVKVISGNADITQFLDIPGTEQNEAGGVVTAQSDAVIDLTKAAVKEEIVRETLDPAKGAVVDLDSLNPELTTANTRIGLIYTFREGRTLAGMKKSGDGHVGDGDPWTPEIKIKGGDSAFYSIGVGMTDGPDSEGGETIPFDDALYCVIDLSGGTSATKYPVSVFEDVPSGGWTEEYKTTKLVLRRIEPGSYLMQNQYEIVLTKPFYIGVFEVTQKQYELVMGSNPSSYRGDARPVECVTYDSIRGTDLGTHWPTDKGVDSQSFLGRLRNKTGLDFDLPTEAEWEYACRAGTTSVYNNGGSSLSDLKQVARCYYNCNDGKGGYSVAHTTVGSYLVNAWGLYDMHGNVWEWCRDWEGSLVAGTDPKGAATSSAGAGRVHRGGCWYGDSNGCTATIRGGGDPSSGDYYKGFRISRTLR